MTLENKKISYLIIDWGTTNFRAFAMNAQNQQVDKKELGMGLLQVEDGKFAQSLEEVLAPWLDTYQALPIFMAGMVGSQAGWVNVDYVSTPTDEASLSANVHSFNLPWGAKATIIPGVSHELETGAYDVMRGEEVQLFGLAKITGKSALNAILPGTHSKHARFENNKMTEFSSFMTGELFSVISQHTILGKGLPEQVDSQPAFLRGVSEGKTDKLTSTLFAARTHRLFNNIKDTEILDYLSGLLIGNELKSLANDHVYLVGGKGLCDRYQLACTELAIESTYMNGDECFLAGMADLITVLNKG
ncbi:2-dehydro-3-deoxygalactonokinase [Colwellia echini]|uniref:2-dehydro-3-deoxygalactonokinase n=1 Tax=Colwellia echini TaxID=1982103 RepID=A0ABY3MYE0_9GAMM|nr:2-dehydro-3-deoxygalactonokinase [Colwellia echini]TYK66245.1 2-dehydro-3-deoxygalactonokinase [Colwellia echini]